MASPAGPRTSGSYAQYVPVRIAPSRCSTSSGWCPLMRTIACRIARVTATRARGRGRGSAVTTTEANSARQLSDEEFAFGAGLRGPRGVSERARLVDVVSDLGEASSVRVLGTCVDHFAGIAECSARQLGRQAALRRRSGRVLRRDQVEHVELEAWVGNEPREVTHSLEVSHSHRAPLERHRPVVALAKEAEVCGRLLVRSVLSGGVHRWIRYLPDLH